MPFRSLGISGLSKASSSFARIGVWFWRSLHLFWTSSILTLTKGPTYVGTFKLDLRSLLKSGCVNVANCSLVDMPVSTAVSARSALICDRPSNVLRFVVFGLVVGRSCAGGLGSAWGLGADGIAEPAAVWCWSCCPCCCCRLSLWLKLGCSCSC